MLPHLIANDRFVNAGAPVVLSGFIHQKDLPKSFGLVLSAQAPLSVIGAPLAGWCFQWFNGNYLPGFLMGGE